MKKIALTLAIILGMGLTMFADPNGGGVFGRGETTEQGSSRLGGTPALPAHGQDSNQPAPLGSGVMVLTALGAAYIVAKKRKD